MPAWIDTAAAEQRALDAKREAGVFASLYSNAQAWFDQIYANNHFRDRWADAKDKDR